MVPAEFRYSEVLDARSADVYGLTSRGILQREVVESIARASATKKRTWPSSTADHATGRPAVDTPIGQPAAHAAWQVRYVRE
jgi:hypothetical protein